MKKLIVLLSLVLLGTSTFAQTVTVQTNVTLENYWVKKDIDEEKVLSVGENILLKNKLNRRIPIILDQTPKLINAFAYPLTKTVHISTGILPYINNDDEMAAILCHEIAHAMEAYGGMNKVLAVSANSKKYEIKSDLNGIDYMVKAGYNPIAMIIISNRLFDEPFWDWGFTSTHPKGSKRVIEMYKYIYVKYPQYLNSPMTETTGYKIFLNAMNDEIKAFQEKQKNKKLKQSEDI